MRRSLALILAALLAATVLTHQPAPAAPPAKAGVVHQSQLIWTSGTLIANAYGTQVYEKTFYWPLVVNGRYVAWPGVYVQFHVRLIDKKVIAGGAWSCKSIDMAHVSGPYAWDEVAPCQLVATAPNLPYRLIDVDFDYQIGNLPTDVDIVDLKVDYLGNIAGMWEWTL